ncbi:unnamed protein product [Lepeophtheirus salmonis]|uniref:(salmon louse) hypothetical protein n=1 Tax=Lepeophtheirus salmonis TaxID=72036 RepID=A0A7R8CJ11_LEPSM|nr:unnamed protein product [Lepeophtheirus salmonis]CAF2800835.1 unnamed protein product [Lepeophtheirus salmonis]
MLASSQNSEVYKVAYSEHGPPESEKDTEFPEHKNLDSEDETVCSEHKQPESDEEIEFPDHKLLHYKDEAVYSKYKIPDFEEKNECPKRNVLDSDDKHYLLQEILVVRITLEENGDCTLFGVISNVKILGKAQCRSEISVNPLFAGTVLTMAYHTFFNSVEQTVYCSYFLFNSSIIFQNNCKSLEVLSSELNLSRRRQCSGS